MSDEWVTKTIQEMQQSQDIDIKAMGDLLDQNKSLIERYVTTVSKDLKQPTIMKLDSF